MILSSVREPLRALLPGEVPPSVRARVAISQPQVQVQCYVNLIYKARTVQQESKSVNPDLGGVAAAIGSVSRMASEPGAPAATETPAAPRPGRSPVPTRRRPDPCRRPAGAPAPKA